MCSSDLEYKKKFKPLSELLKEKLKLLRLLNSQFDNLKEEKQKKRRKKEETILRLKEEDVEKKMKAGKKLTTADLLVFQQTKE